MTVILDSSLLVAALLNDDAAGKWAEELLISEDLVAPHHMPVEVSAILRRAELGGDISAASAIEAHAELLSMGIVLYPYFPLAPRIWELRHSVTTYDAWYVALAEALDAPLATLDLRLTRAPGPRCSFLTP